MTTSREVLLQQARPPYSRLLALSYPQHRSYARQHGLELVRMGGPLIPGWTGHWDAVVVMLVLLESGVDRIFWLDADALIVGDRYFGVALAASGGNLAMVRHPGPPEHWNCGVLMVQNGSHVRAFLQELIDQGPGVFPWFQQQLMNDMLSTSRWRGLIGAPLGDQWNSTWRINEHPAPQVVAWHGWPGGVQAKHQAMRDFVAERGL